MEEYQLTENLIEAIRIAQALAKEHSHPKYSAAHLLKALMHKNIGLIKFLEQIGQDPYYIEEWAEVRLETYPKTSRPPESPAADETIEATLYEADKIKLKLGLQSVSEHCTLIALCTPGVGFTYEQLKSFSVSPKEIIDGISTGDNTVNSLGHSIENNTTGSLSGLSPLINQYCFDKAKAAANNELDQISGRDAEIKMMIEILGRRSKPNVLITGDPGVGKTALFNGLAYTSLKNHVPEHLKLAKIVELDVISLFSGASYKGEVEDRLKKIIEEIKQFPKSILLIDEFNNLTDKNSGNQGLVNLLKSVLAKGEVTIIATATNDAYRKHIEPETGLARQFEVLRLNEPNEEEAFNMIKDTVDVYVDHHELAVDPETIKESIRLAKRYNKERSLPDSALDLIDRTMSAAKYMIETSLIELDNLNSQLNEIKSMDDKELQQKEYLWFYASMKNKLSYLLFNDVDEDNQIDFTSDSQKVFEALEATLAHLKEVASQEKNEISKTDIATTIANKTGIPTGKLQSNEKERLLNMEEHLQKRVIGQNHAVSVITAAVLESRSGLSKPGLPIGSFFFSGPTGTGKTELAKSLAEFLFQDENSILRFDMSEFKEEHSAALLYGAPPGYVGYEEGGLLVNKIRQKPYSIVLFDEIEKAHPSVFDIFLQILDEGKLHDRLGKEGDFSNAVILFTSNIGSDHIVKSFNEGIIPKSSDLLEIMGQYFRPEFLGRLTGIIPFSPIMEENIAKILRIQLKSLYDALEKQEISLTISDAAINYLAKKGYAPKYGARPLRGVIRNDLRSPLSKKIISGSITKGASVNLLLDQENNLIWKH